MSISEWYFKTGEHLRHGHHSEARQTLPQVSPLSFGTPTPRSVMPETWVGPPSSPCVFLPSMLRTRAHLQTKILNTLWRLSSFKQPWCSGGTCIWAPTCTEITLAVGKSGHSLELAPVLHSSLESWDDFYPWISLKVLFVCAKDHLSYFNICFRTRMALWVVRGVKVYWHGPSWVGRETKGKASWPSVQAETQEKEHERCICLHIYWCSGEWNCWKLDLTHYKQTHQTKPFSQSPKK